jgi:hypothetical protein
MGRLPVGYSLLSWAWPSSVASQRVEKLVGRAQPSRIPFKQQIRLRKLPQSNRLMEILGGRRLRRIVPRLCAQFLEF